jgi:hypothetical protein
MIYLAFFSYALIVRIPDCDKVVGVIWERLKELIVAYGLFLGLTTALNFLFERKVERRLNSKEYLVILVFHLTALLLAAVIASYAFYKQCGKD